MVLVITEAPASYLDEELMYWGLGLLGQLGASCRVLACFFNSVSETCSNVWPCRVSWDSQIIHVFHAIGGGLIVGSLAMIASVGERDSIHIYVYTPGFTYIHVST